MSENLGFLAGRKGVEHSLFEQVLQIAKQEGTPGSEQMRSLAKEFLFGDASVYGTASFYDFTREENKGVKVPLGVTLKAFPKPMPPSVVVPYKLPSFPSASASSCGDAPLIRLKGLKDASVDRTPLVATRNTVPTIVGPCSGAVP